MEIESLKEVKVILKSLLISSAKGLTVECLNKDFKEQVGANIPYKKFGFRTIEEFLESLTDTLYIKHGSYKSLIFPVPSEKSEHIRNFIKFQKPLKKKVFERNMTFSEKSISQNFQSRFTKQIKFQKIESKCENLNSTCYISKDFKSDLQRNHSVKDNIKSNENVSQINNCSTLIDTKEYNRNIAEVEQTSDSKLRVLNFLEDIPWKEEKKVSISANEIVTEKESDEKELFEHFNSLALPKVEYNDIIFELDYPDNIVKLGEKILSADIPEHFILNNVILLYVTQIHNPYRFWFHEYKENNEFDTMMSNLHDFYENIAPTELSIRIQKMIPGQICAALYDSVWHRAEILAEPVKNKIKVFFFDYGTVSHVNVNSVKYLLKEFAQLKKQALRGSLSYICPNSDSWPREVAFAFLNMVDGILLNGKITKMLKDDKITQLILTDTNDKEDFQINSSLIYQGCAIYKNEFSNNDNIQLNYPTFEMLEKGEYPSFQEIGDMLSEGIDFENQDQKNIIYDAFTKKCTVKDYLTKLMKYYYK